LPALPERQPRENRLGYSQSKFLCTQTTVEAAGASTIGAVAAGGDSINTWSIQQFAQGRKRKEKKNLATANAEHEQI